MIDLGNNPQEWIGLENLFENLEINRLKDEDIIENEERETQGKEHRDD